LNRILHLCLLMSVKGCHKKKIQEGLCAMVFGNVFMKYIRSLSPRDHKKKAHIKLQLRVFRYGSNFAKFEKKITQQELGYNFECLGIGLILVQIRKKNYPPRAL
jgi:hypothetical protein